MNYIVAICALIIGYLVNPFLQPYIGQKGKNLATIEDIAEITRNELIEKTKRQLKHDACLGALSSIDAKFSHLSWNNVPKQPTKQKLDISKIRECHSKLVLSCENTKIVEKFLEIIILDEGAQPTELLNEFRNLIRLELGLGTELTFNNEKAWIGSLVGDRVEE